MDSLPHPAQDRSRVRIVTTESAQEYVFPSRALCARFCGQMHSLIENINPSKARVLGLRAAGFKRHSLKIFTGTFNVGESKPSKDVGACCGSCIVRGPSCPSPVFVLVSFLFFSIRFHLFIHFLETYIAYTWVWGRKKNSTQNKNIFASK